MATEAGKYHHPGKDLLAVFPLGSIVVRWNSFLILSLGPGIAIGFHELPPPRINTQTHIRITHRHSLIQQKIEVGD